MGMATDNASSRDSAVIDDDLVEALGFEPTSSTKIVDDSQTESESDSVDGSSDDKPDFVSDASETDVSVAEIDSAVADSSPESQSVVILGDSSATTLPDTDVSEPSDVAPTQTPKRRSLFGTRRSQEPKQAAAPPQASTDDGEADGDSEASLGADDFIEELLASEDAVVSEASSQESAEALSGIDVDASDSDSTDLDSTDSDSSDLDSTGSDSSDSKSVDNSESLVLDDIDLDLTDSDSLADSDLVDLTEIDLAEGSIDSTTGSSTAESDIDSASQADLDSSDEASVEVDPVTTESAFPDVPALTEVDQGAATGADMFTQPVEVEKLDVEELDATPDLVVLHDESDSSDTTVTDTADSSAQSETAMGAVSTAMSRRTRVRAKKSRRVIRHVDPWSVLTFSALFHLALYTAFLLAGVLVWEALEASGKVEEIESFIRALGDFETYEINSDVLFRVGVIVAGILTVASTILSVLLCVVFNLISDLVGGIRVTVLEEETVRLPAKNKSPKSK